MPGTDDLYRAARIALLDALFALEAHRDAIILVGAQAIYCRVGEADIAVAPTTTDADLALDPHLLAAFPALDTMMREAGFEKRVRPRQGAQPGIWERAVPGTPILVAVDLLVPAGTASPEGRRSARLPGHARDAAMKVVGIEGALVDNDYMEIKDASGRSCSVRVAGPAALLVAKVHKIEDRLSTPSRLIDKDALDVFRLLRGTATGEMADRMRLVLSDYRSRPVAEQALEVMPRLFGGLEGDGVKMAIRATDPLMSAAEVGASMMALTADLLSDLMSR